jgi:signal recognition particle receptor subunit beta
MSKIVELLKEIKENTGLEIVDKSFNGVPLFDTPTHQPFDFDVTIEFSGIRGMSDFEVHFPSLYIKSNETDTFAQTITNVTVIVNKLNEALKKEYSSEWVRQ